MRKHISTKATEKVVKMAEPLIISMGKQQSPKPQKKTYFSTNDFIISSLRKEPLSDQQMKQKEFKLKQKDLKLKEKDYKLKQKDQDLKEKDYALKKKQAVLTVIGLAAPATMAGIAYKNLKNSAQEKTRALADKDKETQINDLKSQANDLKTQIQMLNAQNLEFQTDLKRLQKQEEERLKQGENSLYNMVFGSGRRVGP